MGTDELATITGMASPRTSRRVGELIGRVWIPHRTAAGPSSALC
jgi:hypothetical protein